MEKNLFEVGADIDVEALMSRLRETAKQRGRATSIAPPKEPEPGILQTLQPQRLTQEIQNGGLSADVINHLPLKNRGAKGRIELQVKKFVKWLVHWNTSGQAEFNHSVVRSLGLIAEDLQAAQESFATIEALVRDIAAQSSEFEKSMQSELRSAVSPLREDLDRNGAQTRLLTEQVSAFSSRLEESDVAAAKIARQQEANFRATEATLRGEMNRLLMDQASCFSAILEQQASSFSAMLEQKVGPMIEESTQHLRADFGTTEATLREEANRLLVEQASCFSAMLEQKVGPMIEESAQHLQGDFGTVEATLREEMSRKIQQLLEETRGKNETLVAQLAELMVKLDHKFGEFAMRTLRVERLARNASPDLDAAEGVNREDLSLAQPDIRDQRRNGKEKTGRGKRTGKRISSGNPFGQAFDYFLFEHRHRGPVSEIKRRQSTYLDLFRWKENVVDLGCGRGEFVELLSENGINVTGVDINEDMVDFCRDRGLSVVQSDIFDYLTGLSDKTLDGIFLSQVVEHLSPERILELISLCSKKLGPGGVIVAETVNTNCPVALSNFYLDPTHVRPVPPEMLSFMFEQEALRVQTFRFSSPLAGNNTDEVLDTSSGFAQEGRIYQDYAVVALASD